MPNAGEGAAGDGRRATFAVAAGAAALAAAAALPGAIDLPLWQDEVASARVLLEGTPAGVVEHVSRTESTPPGWYLLAWALRETGIPVEGLRFLSVALAAALAGLTVVYARRFLPLWTAGLAGAAHRARLADGRPRERAACVLAPRAPDAGLRAPPRAGRRAGLRSAGWRRSRRAPPRGPTRTTSSCSRPRRRSSGWPSSGSCGPSPCAWRPRSSSARPRCSPGSPASSSRWAPSASAGSTPSTRVKFARAPVRALLGPGDDVRGARQRPGRGRGGRARRDPRARPRRLLRCWRGSAPRPACARSWSSCPVGVSGIAWLAGLRIVTGRNLIGVTAFAAVALAAVLLPLPRRAALAAGAAGLALAVFGYVAQPDGRARRLRPRGGRARRDRLGAGRPDPRRRLAPGLPLAARVVPAGRRHASRGRARWRRAPSCGS